MTGLPTRLPVVLGKVDRVLLDVDEETYDFGPLAAGATAATGLDYFTLENKSSFPVDVYIKGTDLTNGNTWALANDGNPGEDIVALHAGLEGGSYNIIIKKDEPYNVLKSSLGSGSTQKWGLQIKTPTSFSNPDDISEKSGTITLIGVAS